MLGQLHGLGRSTAFLWSSFCIPCLQPRRGQDMLLLRLMSSMTSMKVDGVPSGTRGCCLHLYTSRSHPCSLFESSSIPRNNAGSSELGTGYAMVARFWDRGSSSLENSLLGKFGFGFGAAPDRLKKHPQNVYPLEFQVFQDIENKLENWSRERSNLMHDMQR
jgi:hypothetical protein